MKKYLNNVKEYIENCPKEAQDKLRTMRNTILEVAPDSTERTDYFKIPGYSYGGYDYDGMFVWFSFKQPNLRLHVRPPVIQEHIKELVDYTVTKSIINFPMDKEVPITLVKKLVKASINIMKAKH